MKMLQIAMLVGVLAVPWTTVSIEQSGSPFAVAVAQEAPAPDAPVAGDAPDVNRRAGDAWYANPFVLVVAAIGLLLVLALIAIAARGNGTTIIKDDR